MTLRIELAIARAKEKTGKKIFKKEIAAALWPDSVESSQMVNMTNLVNGTTARVAPEWIVTICEMTGCSADFLLGLSNE